MWGIAPQDLERIFEPFFQADQKYTRVVLAEGEEISLNEFPQIAAQACERDRPAEPPRPERRPALQ